MNHITPDELSYWLRIAHLPSVTTLRLKKLLAHFQSIDAICRASDHALQQFGLNEAHIPSIKKPNHTMIDQAVRWSQESDHHIIPFTDARYPTLLAETSGSPAILYIQGDITTLSQPQIAMVGSRKPSYTGLELATEFAFGLTQSGLTITSGLALGIDTACHEGALKANGKTIAVLGSGLQCLYPKRNAGLAERITHSGCLISEFPLNATPNAEHFPRRNRIISGLSLGTLVVEAALHSGSLITARYANEQNRDVFAIPSSPRNAIAKGCLSLIQQGAKCVTCIDDILNEIRYDALNFNVNSVQHSIFKQNDSLDSIEQQVLACIEDLTTIDQICARSKLSAQCVIGTVLQLELKEVVRNVHGGYVQTTRTDSR